MLKKRERHTIQLEPGCEIDICMAVEDAILDHGLPVYVRAGTLVEGIEADTLVARDEDDYGQERTVRLMPIDVQRMKHIMGETCLFAKWDKKGKQWIPAATPIDIAYLLLARVGHWPFPEVTNIVAAQTLDRKGEIVNVSGVHRPSRLLLAKLPTLPSIITSGDKTEAHDGIDLLNDLIAEYEFANEASRSVALSMLITPVIRGVVPMAPMHAVTAPTPGSGKSYLSRLASLIATGAPCPVIPPASEPEEFEKRLTSALLHGTPIISLDNIVQRLSSPLLCQALTEPVIDVRPLGASAMARIEQRVTFFANGNNLTIVDDLTRRCLLASVDRNEENPEEHEYSNRPHQLIVEDRGKYVHACLTVVSSYMKTKRAAKLPPLANYEDWSRTVREALVWLGYDDPVMTMRNLRENDPERNKREAIFANWPQDALNHDGIAVNLLTVADLIEAPGQSSGDLSGWQDALKLVASTAKGEVDKREFGRWLGKQKGKVVAGKKLVAVMDKKKKILKWGCMVVADGMVGEQSDLF